MASGAATNRAAEDSQGAQPRSIDAAGVRTSFVEHGAGDPVVLLHGGGASGDSWGAQVPVLAERYRVFVPERRGHGRTPDVEGPHTYEAMADETIAFLEQVAGGPAHLIGWSDGGTVALHVVHDRPDLVRSVVTMGSVFHFEGLHPAFHTLFSDDPDSPKQAPLREAYEANSPDGAEHWPVFWRKMLTMWRTGPTMTVDDLRRIDRPVLVMVGDDDGVTYAHTATMFESLPRGQLAVIPGASHAAPIEKPALVNSMVLDFLADSTPNRMVPVRSAHEEIVG